MNIPTGYRVRGQKTLTLFSFVWRKRDSSLTTEYPFAKYFLFVIVISISVSRGTPRPAVRQRAITTYSKYRAAPDFAVTHKEDNDTPVQSQSERDKTVARNEGGSGRPSVGVELPWRQFAADRLATSLRETHWYLGVSRTNRDASIIKPNTRRSMETENCLCSPDLKNFLVFG